METATQEDEYFSKLESVKDIRQKTIQAEKMKLNMKDLLEELNNEEKCLQDYQTEIDLLIQEKMAHVEELRLIHTDINTMENLTKQAKSSRQRIVDEVRKTYEEFVPLKKELNKMRESVGVEPLQDSDTLTAVPQLQDSQITETKTHPTMENLDPSSAVVNLPCESTPAGKLALGKSTIRQQQPPPMKSCQSCHQLIHRNAPICPLCKAKSRSRNPKKTKRKHDF